MPHISCKSEKKFVKHIQTSNWDSENCTFWDNLICAIKFDEKLQQNLWNDDHVVLLLFLQSLVHYSARAEECLLACSINFEGILNSNEEISQSPNSLKATAVGYLWSHWLCDWMQHQTLQHKKKTVIPTSDNANSEIVCFSGIVIDCSQKKEQLTTQNCQGGRVEDRSTNPAWTMTCFFTFRTMSQTAFWEIMHLEYKCHGVEFETKA